MTLNNPIELEKIEYFSKPYPHFYSVQALALDTSKQVLEWLDSDAPWELVETSFYEQFEFNLIDTKMPSHLNFLCNSAFTHSLIEVMCKNFNVDFDNNVSIVAHKLIPGQSIRIHNDNLEGAETHRLVIQFNFGWAKADGGLFIIFGSDDAEDIRRVIAPLHNSAVGFSISCDSYHAVSTIHSDVRYSIVFSFRRL